MKTSLVALFGLVLSVSAHACVGSCVNESGNPALNSFCEAKSPFGYGACVAGNTCTWYQAQPVQHPGRCVNESGNSALDSFCEAKAPFGAAPCMAGNTCAWYPGQVTCQF